MAANPYDPITTTDFTKLTDDDWGLTLPPLRYKTYTGSSRFKYLCNELRKRPWCVIITLAVLCIVILISIVIGATSQKEGGHPTRHPTGDEPDWDPNNSLVFYPANKSILIRFNPENIDDVKTNVWSLHNVTEGYLLTEQLGDDFVTCNSTYQPFNKTCKNERTQFGSVCTEQNKYGYSDAQPCVFIQLNLPDNRVITPISKDSPLWEIAKAQPAGYSDSSRVPVTCAGTVSVNLFIFYYFLGKGHHINQEWILYFPNTGFPSYIYRRRDMSLPFLKPALFVQFPALKDEQLVHVTCTAWGQLYDFNKTLVKHDLLRTQFALYIRRG
ncbi:unnamed protein product [Lymnaea stagnalis]|uniref:Uncharacterized protein n=1 Tax=Lymnaea stagnalis TaxID=6523 RepID=A0AAV2I1J0_LYMST